MNQPITNQYAAPTAHVADVASSSRVGELMLFSSHGRIGRLRYLAYAGGASIIYFLVLTVLGALFLGSPVLAAITTIAALVGFLWFSIIIGIKRLHDMGHSGWWSITSFIPFVALVFLVAPGTKGDNRFGPPPPPNNWGVRILALIFPFFFVFGILAAIAIPQYKAYTDKARAARQLQQQQQQQPSAN